jgi:dTDP-4-dehydrorhamnose 3,5-epimerase
VFAELYKLSNTPNFKAVQSNCSISKAGVLRGIHRTPYAKMVTCIHGCIYDVCVDLRPDSKTYLQYFGLYLDSSGLQSIYIPPYCGHGFLSLEESAVLYHQDAEYNADVDETYCYKHFNIQWPREPLIVSDKDINICEQTATIIL